MIITYWRVELSMVKYLKEVSDKALVHFILLIHRIYSAHWLS